MVQENTVSDKAIWKVRPYGEAVGDYQMVSGWKQDRGLGILMENTLPPDGVIVEMDGQPVMAAWLYLCYGIGVSFLEGLITRPGLSLSTAREALKHCIGILKAIASENNIGIIKGYVSPPVARESVSAGFVIGTEPMTPIFITTF